MSDASGQTERRQSLVIQAPLVEKGARVPASLPGTDKTPKVVIRGDIRLQVVESDLACETVRGHYSIDVVEMQEPLQVIWIAEGNVLDRTAQAVGIEFDMQGARAGQVRTFVVAAQVTERGGLGRIVHSSTFVQILVAHCDFPRRIA